MKMPLKIVLLLLIFSFVAHASVAPIPPGNTSLQKLEQEVRPNKSLLVSGLKTPWEFLAQVSIVTPSELTLSHGSYSVPYSENLDGTPAFHLGISIPLASWKSVVLYGQVQCGFSVTRGLRRVIHQSDPFFVPQQNSVTLLRIPLNISVKALYQIPGLFYVKPTLTLGSGFQWMHQTSSLDGVNHDFWVPFVFFTPALTFFEGTEPTDWFGGFSFGLTYQNSIGSRQIMRGWSFDLTTHFVF